MQTAGDYLVQCRGNPRRQWRRKLAPLSGHCAEDVNLVLAVGCLREWQRSGRSLVQHNSQRIDIGGLGNRLLRRFGLGCKGVEMFGGHVRQCSTEAIIGGPRIDLLKRQVEINEQRAAILVEHDIARLDIAMDHPTTVGVIQGFCQACSDPADGFDPVESGQQFAVSHGGRVECRRPFDEAIEGVQQFLPASLGGEISGQLIEHRLQGRAGYVLHAQQAGAAVEGRLGEDLHDVLVFQPRHLAAFPPLPRGDFQGHLAFQRNLPGKIYVPKPPRPNKLMISKSSIRVPGLMSSIEIGLTSEKAVARGAGNWCEPRAANIDQRFVLGRGKKSR